MMKTAIIIPSHLKAKRLPNKPLLEINGKPMILHVWERAKKTKIEDVFVATANNEIADLINSVGGNAILTSEHHTTGTDRINEAREKLKLDHEIIINVQGDMPNINPETINLLNNFMITNPNAHVSTVAGDVLEKEWLDPNVVKVKTLKKLEVNQFLPANDFNRNFKKDESFVYHHIGLYAYTSGLLKSFVSLEKSSNEKSRSLEQMRLLDNNYNIYVGYTKDMPLSVDTQEDLEEIRKII